MNFCGSSTVDTQTVLSDDEQDPGFGTSQRLYCVAAAAEDVDEGNKQQLDLPPAQEIITSTTSTTTARKTQSRMNSVWSGAEDEDDADEESIKQPATLALDTIQHTLSDKRNKARKPEILPKEANESPPENSRTIPIPVVKTPPPMSRRVNNTSCDNDDAAPDSLVGGGGTPSPILLNPLSARADWIADDSLAIDDIQLQVRRRRFLPLASATATAAAKSAAAASTTTTTSVAAAAAAGTTQAPCDTLNSRLMCPELSSNRTLESLMNRLQAGFNVRLLQDDKLGPVFLYLHFDRSKLCIIRGNSYDGVEEKKVIDEWIELHMSKILRLEVGKASHPLASKTQSAGTNTLNFFSIVVNQDSNIVYYDFEAHSPLEREVLVSTLIVVLDQEQQNPSLSMRREPQQFVPDQEEHYEDLSSPKEGTCDEPIPCSPSLELDDSFSSPMLSPRKRTHIYDDGNDGTETSLAESEAAASGVIHLEHVDSSTSGIFLPTVDESEASDCFIIPTEPSLSYKSESGVKLDGGQLVPAARGSGDGTLRHVRHNSIDFDRVRHNSIDFDASVTGGQLSGGGWGCADTDICTLALTDLAETCSSVFSKKAPSSEADKRMMIEEYIANALGSPSAAYSYMFMREGDVWNADEASQGSKEEKETRTLGRVRNRASLLNAQASRLRTLRNEMTFAAALQQSKEHMHFVQTTQSFDDASRSGKGRKVKAASEVANRFHSSALLHHIVGNMAVSGPTEPAEEPEEDVAYYDSDPEDARQRTMKRGPRRVTADRLNKVESDLEPSPRAQALEGVGFENIGSSKKVSKKLDEDVIVEIVQAMNNERLTLMWHPTQTIDSPNRSPACVKLWIEAGVYLADGSFLLPKLTWVKGSDFDPTQQRFPKSEPKALDLLDICRIRPTSKIDRTAHPFADASKSFVIETQTDLFLFASQSNEERDRIVYGLKLVIARLASLLMLRDIRAAEEFFGAIVNNVPGEAPAIITGKEEDGAEEPL